jgi:hypothetical protein
MHTFLIMVAPVLIIVFTLGGLFVWGAFGKSPYEK